MIQANELRIGNWVLDDEGTICKVCRVQSPRFTAYNGVEYIHVYIQIKDRYFETQYVDPIPLTEEILLKCGFELGAYNWYMLMFKNKNIKINIKSNMLCIESYYDGEIKSSMQILGLEKKKLHQLQNLYFALTGTELEIKL